MRHLRRRVAVVLCVVAVGTACSTESEEPEATAASVAAEAAEIEPGEPSPAVEAEVVEETAKALSERQAMLEEAHAALDETNAELKALDQGKTQEALDALARATDAWWEAALGTRLQAARRDAREILPRLIRRHEMSEDKAHELLLRIEETLDGLEAWRADFLRWLRTQLDDLRSRLADTDDEES